MSDHGRARVLASGFVTLLASQIGTRLVTFAINLLIARHLTPEAYGLSTVQFHLLTTTALFISREGLRRGCLRFGGSGGGSGSSKGVADGDGVGGGVDSVGVLRVACLVLPLGSLVTAAVCGVTLWRHGGGGSGGSGGGGEAVPYYREAVILHGVAALLELLAEPFYILTSVHLMFGSRVAIEFASTLAKSLLTLGLLLLPPRLGAAPPPPALLFSAAQLGLAGVALAGYWLVGLRILAEDRRRRRRRSGGATDAQQEDGVDGKPPRQDGGAQSKGGAKDEGLPRRTGATSDGRAAAESGSGSDSTAAGNRTGDKGSDGAAGAWLRPWSPLEWSVLGTSALFTLQAVEKLVLAEGSKLVLATLQSAMNQGVYGLVSNLGSLVVRTLFQPLEEAAFAAFSAWGAEARAEEATEAAAAAAGDGAGGKETAKRPRDGGAGGSAAAARLAPLAGALGPMVKAVATLGLAAAAFGPPYAYTLLRAVYGLRWSEGEAPTVLAAYSVYVLLLALNGIGEAFVHAVLDSAGLRASNAALLAFSGLHLAACVGLVARHGAVGLVAADGANMALRIAYSGWCIRRFFRPLPSFSLAGDLLPAPGSIAAFAAAGAAAAVSRHVFLIAPGTDGSTPQRVFLRRAGAHVAVGVVLLAGVAGVLARTERAALRQVLDMRRRRRGGRGQGQEGKEGGGAVKED